MARASAKGGRRPQPNARKRREQLEKQAAASSTPRPKQARPEYEDGLFFLKLRRRAKWIFAALAVAFALGFIVFGVGTGSSQGSLGDVLRDLFGGGGSDNEVPAIADALEKVGENPDDPDAQRDLGEAYSREGRFEDAAASLEKAVELAPTDAQALSLLARVYGALAGVENQRAGSLAGGSRFSQTAYTFPGASGFIGAVGENPIEEAITFARSKSASLAGNEVTAWYQKQVATYEKLVAADPEDTTNVYQLAQAASQSGETDKAIDAYEKYLELDPEGDYAQPAQEQLDQLTGSTDVVTG